MQHIDFYHQIGRMHNKIGTTERCASYQTCNIPHIGAGWTVCPSWFKPSATHSGMFNFLYFLCLSFFFLYFYGNIQFLHSSYNRWKGMGLLP